MAVELQTIKYEGPAGVLAWKHPAEDFTTGSRLIVHESQEALFMSGGEAMDLFGPGTHILDTENLPYVAKWYEKLFGVGQRLDAETPFHCEVYFVNKSTIMDILWGTASPIPLEDPKAEIIVPVRANGQFSIRVSDSRKLLLKLVGTTTSLDKETTHSYFKGLLMMDIKDYISNLMIRKRISFLEVHSYLKQVSEDIRSQVADVFNEYGIEIERFFVNSISVPDDDPGYITIRNALAAAKGQALRAKGKRAEMDTIGYTYQQEQTFDVLKKAAQNEGTSSNIVGLGLGLGMGTGVGGMVGGAMADVVQNYAGEKASAPKETSRYTQSAEETPVTQGRYTQGDGSVSAASSRFTGRGEVSSSQPADGMAAFRQRIEMLKMLKENGMVTDEEFETKRKELLNGL